MFYMKTLRFTESQTINILKQAKAGTLMPEFCRVQRCSTNDVAKWRYGRVDDDED